MTLVDVNTSTEPSTNQPRSISRFTGCVHVNAFTGRVLQGWRPVFHTDGSEGMVAFDKHGLRISCDNVPTTMTETEMGTNLILALKKYGSIVSTQAACARSRIALLMAGVLQHVPVCAQPRRQVREGLREHVREGHW